MTNDPRTGRAFSTYLELSRALNTVDGLMGRQLANHGLTVPQFRILEELLHRGPTDQVELGIDSLAGPSSTSKVLMRMQRRSLIGRTDHGVDKRKWIVHLTPEGRALVREVFPHQAKLIRAQMAALIAREQDTLRRLCKKLGDGDARSFISELTVVEEEE